MSARSTFTLERYLQRIGFVGVPRPDLGGITALMRAQLIAVPFENLDIQAGQIVSLEEDDIVEKVLERRRGGYCFEVNSLFAMALQVLAVPHFLIAARPITHHGGPKPKTHMAVVAKIWGEKWLCDCGFGAYGIRAPLRIGLPATEVNQDGELFRLDGLNDQELVLRTKVRDRWEDQYSFDLLPHDLTDFVSANVYNSTHPDSLFVRKLLVLRNTPTGRIVLFGHQLKIIDGDHVEKIPMTSENRAALLRDHFGLVDPHQRTA